ncbi:glycosyltransferase family 4 protein [Blastococcus tunisiensis]|uniref:glycosyltransferase family 4 protein n=1 Tax=Blastococcus tunisiensis TaxID=1798228 RepID=UPI001C31518B|nr:glycosyltransferase family 1 protein [Blastococcus sp. DSM 46838]
MDGTPLLGTATGVGTYVRGLLAGLADLGHRPRAVPFTLRAGGRPDGLPSAVTWRHVPAPARLLQAAWARTPLPPVEVFAGNVDVFHATNFVAPPSLRARSVVTVHDLTYLRHPQWVTPAVARYTDLVPRALRNTAAIVVTPSRAVADEVREAYGLPAERVVATPLGVDPAWAQAVPADDAWLTSRGLPGRFVLFTGTREPRKNLTTLLDAHARARAAGEVPDLVIAGPVGWGPELPARPGVHLTGWLDPGDLRALVARAAAAALPSHYEGFGLPVLEAMAAGTPVLASDLPVHREVAGGHARLVPPTDVDAWAAALLALPPRRPGSVAAAREWAVGHTWTECARRTVGAYERSRA